MEYPITNATPTVLVSSFDALQRSILVPSAVAKDHRVLVQLAQHRFGKHFSASDFEVHFHYTFRHIKSDRCDAQIHEYLYNMGAYFTGEYLQRGILCLVAHFVAKSPMLTQRQGVVGREESGPTQNLRANPAVDFNSLPSLDYRRARNFRGRCPPAPRRSINLDSPSSKLQPILKVDDSPVPQQNASDVGTHYEGVGVRRDSPEVHFHGLPLAKYPSADGLSSIESEMSDKVFYHTMPLANQEMDDTPTVMAEANVDAPLAPQPTIARAKAVVHVYSSPELSDDEMEDDDHFSDVSEHFSDASSHSMEESDYSPESDDSQEETDYCSEESEDFSEMVGDSHEAKNPSIERSDTDDESWYTQFMGDLRQYSDTPASDCTSTESGSQSPERRAQRTSDYSALPKKATARQYLKDLDKLISTGPPRGSRHYRKLYQRRVRNHKRFVHAELIERDNYGVDAMHGCRACIRRGETCRIYHPTMHTSPWTRGFEGHIRVGWSCSGCRASRRPGCNAA